eukprot:4843775-Prymnesium_polylepis.3
MISRCHSVHVLSGYTHFGFAMSAPSSAPQPSIAGQLAIELERNRELTRTLYALRGEPPPNDVA